MKKTFYDNKDDMKAWIVFCKDTDLFWLKFLKSGFRHCFLILNDGKNWITYDPMSSFTEIKIHEIPLSFNFPNWFTRQGHTVLSSFTKKTKKLAPVSFFTCVEGVKRVLGIHKITIITPYQLYKYLLKQKG